MIQIIKPIETIYNGYRFRSRLEARWAVFFDSIGWDYEYEPQGFELPSGLRYLPDFLVWINLYNYDKVEPYYVEIKPKGVPMSDYERKKIAGFSRQKDLLLLEDTPSVNSVYKIISNIDGSIEDTDFIFEAHKYGIYYSSDSLADISDEDASPRTFNAIRMARGARFEFGEERGR